MGLQAHASGRCTSYGENRIGNLDDASIAGARCKWNGQQPQRVLA